MPLKGSGRGTVLVFSCVPTAEPTRLQGLAAPNVRSHRWSWLNSGCPRTKQIDMHVGKGICKEEWGLTGVGGGDKERWLERNQNELHACKTKNKFS